jgi:hypothetical protein
MSEASDALTLRLNVKFREGTAPTLQAELLRLPGRQRVKRLLELGSLGLMAERGISAEGGTRSSPALNTPKLDTVPLQAGAAPGEQPVERLSEPPVPSQELSSLELMAERGMSAEGGIRSSPGLTTPKLDAVAHQAAAPPGGQTIEKLSDAAGPSQEVGKIPIAGVVAAVEANQSPDHQQRAEETPGLSTRPRRRPGFNVDLTG